MGRGRLKIGSLSGDGFYGLRHLAAVRRLGVLCLFWTLQLQVNVREDAQGRGEQPRGARTPSE